MTKTLLAVDGMAYIFRAFYAVPYMCSHAGIPTNAVYGFHKLLQSLVNEIEPDHLVVAFDVAEPTFRDEVFSDYKANRPEAPEELISQIDLVKEYLRAMRIPILECPGFEADDVLATVAMKAKEAGIKALIATGDKDLCQLVDDDIFIVRSSMREVEILDRGGVMRHYGVWPEQIVDYLTIVGDSADNVPGVKGIGQKGARDLLEAYGTLDNIYASLGKLSPSNQRKLEEAKDHIENTRFLIKIRCDAPVKIELKDTMRCECDCGLVNEFCRKYDFQSLRAPEAKKVEAASEPQQQELF